MDSHLIDSLVQGVGIILAWKGWDHIVLPWLKSRREPATIAPHHTNGFTRDDHASLAVLVSKVEHVDVTLGKLDNIVGRLVVVLEMNDALRRPD